MLQYIDRYVSSDRYCIPMDKLDRAIQRSEEKFFEECDPGNCEFVFVVIMVLLSSSGQFPLWCCLSNSMHWYL